MAGGVLHHGLKINCRGVTAEAHRALQLQARLGIHRSAQPYLATLALPHQLKGVGTVIERV